MERYPATKSIFGRHKLDACCGGAHSIVIAALATGLDPDTLIAELNRAIGDAA